MSWIWVLTLGGVRPCRGHEFWHLVRPLWGHLSFYPYRVRPRCGLWSWPLVGSVHFVDLFKFFALVGFVHVVDYGLDPWWGPSTLWTGLDLPWGSSTLWTCLSLWPWLGPSTLWTGLDPPWGPSTLWTCWSFLPLLGPSTLWTGVLTLSGVRPLIVVIF